MEEKNGISVVDFKGFLEGKDKQPVADAILESFKRTGFVYLINHGLSQEKIKGMFEMSKFMYSQPTEVKMLAPHPASGKHHRGYSAPGVEKVVDQVFDEEVIKTTRAKAQDVKESFEVGREDDPYQPNIWFPEGVLPGFRETCMDYYWACDKVKLSVLSAIAVALRLPEDYFDEYHQNSYNQLRLLHYPSVSISALEKGEVARIGAHSDFCSITLLVQDDGGGLEVEDPQRPGTFLPVSPIENSIVVNAGDFMQRWSNDLIKSTVHRVRSPPQLQNIEGMTPDRYSIVYFCATDFEKVVECLPGTYSDDNPKKYEPISALDYIMKRLAANY